MKVSIRLLIELAVFSAAAIALLAADEPALAAVLAISAFGSSALNARTA